MSSKQLAGQQNYVITLAEYLEDNGCSPIDKCRVKINFIILLGKKI